MKKNDRIHMTITDCTLSGSGVGHADGMAVLVPAAAVGDAAEVQIVKVNKTFAFGRLVSIMTPSPDRIENDCPAFPQCGGCLFRHISYDAELRLKEKQVRENMRRIGHYDGEVQSITPSPQTDGYRNKAQFPLAVQKGKICIGFFAPRSHRVVDCRNCRLQPTDFADVLSVFDKWITTYQIPVYDETTGKGLLRHVYIREGVQTGELLICAVSKAKNLPHTDALCRALCDAVPRIRSVVLNVNPDDTNVILGKTCIPLFGDCVIEDELCGLRFRLSPLSFYQVNAPQAENLYRKAAEFAEPKGKTVLDLYCGTGTIGLTMAKDAQEIIGVEIVPDAVRDAEANAARNGITNARFLCADAAQAAAKLQSEGIRPDVILVDPPRKGCAPDLLETILHMAPDTLVYISCDSATLARDCAILQDGGYTVDAVAPFDMFPRTGHVETVVRLSNIRTTNSEES